MELAGLKVVMEADFNAVTTAFAMANSMAQDFANNVKTAFNSIPDFKNKFNFTSNGASQAAQDAREYARAAREQAAADLDAAKAAKILAQEEERKNNKNKEAKDIYGQLVAENQALVRAYYNAAAAIIKQGDAAGISAEKLEEMRQKALAGQQQLQAIEAGAGRFQRNVGNYASGFNPLNNSIMQLTREFPAFANSVQTGLMGISNNIAPISDAIAQIRREEKLARAEAEKLMAAKYAQAEAAALAAGATAAEAKAEAKLAGALAVATPEQIRAATSARVLAENAALAAGATQQQAKAAGALAGAQAIANTTAAAAPGIVSKLAGAIFSWQTALSVGITLLTVYGPKLFEMAKGMSGTETAATRAAKAQEEYNKATKEATDTATQSAIKEQSNAAVLYAASQNVSLSYGERKTAAKALIAIAPQLFKDLNEEAIVAGRASEAYRNLTLAIKDKIAVAVGQRQAEQLLTETTAAKDLVDQHRELAGIQDKINKNRKENWDLASRGYRTDSKQARALQEEYKNLMIQARKVTGTSIAFEVQFPKKTEQEEAINGYVDAMSRYGQKVNEISGLRGKIDEIFKPVTKEKAAKAGKDVRNVSDAYDDLIKNNKKANADLESESITTEAKMNKIASNYRAYAAELMAVFNVPVDDSRITDALSKATEFSLKRIDPSPLQKLTVDIKKVGPAAQISFATFAESLKMANAALKQMEFEKTMQRLLENVQALIADTLASTVVLVAEGIGNVIAGTGGIGDLFKSIGQFLGDQIIAFGKQLIAAGGLMQAAQAAIKALSITPAAAVIAGAAAVVLGASLKAALSKNSKNVGRSKFANGGVIYGPTNALVGEYGGARTNPEVIAPLDKLKNILQGEGIGSNGVQVMIPDVTIKGQDLLLSFKRAEKNFNR